MSFYTSLTGINAATVELAVTSNNIANSGTSGFKKSSAEFGDIFATSPFQKSSSVVGNGVSLKEMRQEFSQGNVEFSSNSLDLAITGDGFFALGTPDGAKVFTRNGGFMLNDQNQMVNSAGQSLMALPVDSTNKADFSEPLTALTIPRTTVSEFRATTSVELGLNLPSASVPITAEFNPSKPETYHKTTSFTVYGASGASHLTTIYYVKTANATADNPQNKWQTYVYVDDKPVQPALLQAADNVGGEYFVNKYGELKTRSQLRELQRTSIESDKYLITTGTVYKKFSFDKLSKPVESAPASLELKINPENPYYDRLNLTNNQNGIDFKGLTRANLANMFKVSCDGSGFAQIGLEHLAGREDLMSGAELAFELTNVMNTRFGDGRNFQFSPPATGVPGANKFTLTRVDDATGKDIRLSIDITAAATALKAMTGEIEVLSAGNEITPENLTYMLNQILQGKLTTGVTLAGSAATPKIDDFKDLLVEYDFSSQGFKVTQTAADRVRRLFVSNADATTGAGEHPVFGGAPYKAATTGPTVPAQYGREILPLDTDNSVLLLRSIMPNGNLITASRDQRFGMNVVYSDSAFFIRSGSTGDTSSLKLQLNSNTTVSGGVETKTLTDASKLAKELFGIAESGESVEPQVSQINNLPTVRGQLSTPAIVKGTQMGIDPRKSFTVSAANRNLTVIVDGISSQIQLTQGQYSIGTFTKHLQDKINLMADALGRQVSGVRVDFDEGTEALVIRGATASDDSFIQISGSADWGLENIDAAFGKTSTYIRLTQDQDGSSPVYAVQDKSGNWTESSDKADFDELDIPYWSPIFLDKGELTFDTSGKIISPLGGTKMRSEAITGTTVSIDYAKSTQYNNPFTVMSQAQNGASEGDLVGVNIGDDGLVVASYSNGTQSSLGKIIIANFKTPQGLRQIGDSNYMETAKSGSVAYGEAGSAGFGTLRAGAKERSNVDLTSELVDLITAQRNFQANAKAIETSSSMTQTIINIRG